MKPLAAKLALAALYPLRVAVWQHDFDSAAARAADWRRHNNMFLLLTPNGRAAALVDTPPVGDAPPGQDFGAAA